MQVAERLYMIIEGRQVPRTNRSTGGTFGRGQRKFICFKGFVKGIAGQILSRMMSFQRHELQAWCVEEFHAFE